MKIFPPENLSRKINSSGDFIDHNKTNKSNSFSEVKYYFILYYIIILLGTMLI